MLFSDRKRVVKINLIVLREGERIKKSFRLEQVI